MSKENETEKEKSGAEIVLEALGPRLDKMEKSIEDLHQHSPRKEEPQKKEEVISSDDRTESHRNLKQQHPDWEFCPFCDKPEKLPGAEVDPRTVPGPDNREVKCDTCGKLGLEKYERCPGCGATEGFQYTD